MTAPVETDCAAWLVALDIDGHRAPRADLDAQCLGVSAHGLGASDGLRWAVERGEVAVAGALHHRAAESADQRDL